MGTAIVRVNTSAPFPSLVVGSGPITIGKQNGIWTVGANYTVLGIQTPPAGNLPTDYIAVFDAVAGTFFRISLGALLTTLGGLVSGGARTQRSVTASPIVIAGNDQILNVNINSGSPTCSLPASSARSGLPLTFSDVGGQFAAHNLTITANGAEKINGLSSIVFNTNYQSVTINPANDGVNTGWSIQ